MFTNSPQVMNRPRPKKYGTKKLIEGEFSAGQRALVIEDVVTTGASMYVSKSCVYVSNQYEHSKRWTQPFVCRPHCQLLFILASCRIEKRNKKTRIDRQFIDSCRAVLKNKTSSGAKRIIQICIFIIFFCISASRRSKCVERRHRDASRRSAFDGLFRRSETRAS